MLEGELPDATADAIIRKVIVPRFRGGDMPGGIRAGVDAIIVALGGWPLAVRLLEPLAARLARSPLRPLVPARDGQ